MSLITALVMAAGLAVVTGVSPAFATDTPGSPDAAFTTALGTGFNDRVAAISMQSDGKIIVGGDFTSLDGTTRNRLVRLNSDGSLDTDFSTALGDGFDGSVYGTAVQSDGKILVVGTFTSVDATPSNYLARLNADGSVDTDFASALGSGFDSVVTTVGVQSDGKILVGGVFTSFDGTSINRFARVNSDGSLDINFRTALGTGANNLVSDIGVQSDGKIVVGGAFTWLGGTSSSRLARVNADGSVDADFSTALGTGFNNTVTTVGVQSDGKIVVGGAFSSFDGTSSSRLARVNSDGSVDADFSTALGSGFADDVNTLMVQSDGQLVVGGDFSSVDGTSSNSLARLNSDGSVDADFSTALGTGFDGRVFSVAIQSDGKIVVGGSFSSVDGTQSDRLARLFGDPPAPGPGPAPDGSTAVPNVPQSVAVKGGQFAKRFVVSWSAPRVEVGRPVDGYRVTVKQKGKKKALITTNLSAETLSYVVKRSTLLKKTTRSRGDMSGTSYRYNVWVQAVNDKGVSTAAKERIMVTVKN